MVGPYFKTKQQSPQTDHPDDLPQVPNGKLEHLKRVPHRLTPKLVLLQETDLGKEAACPAPGIGFYSLLGLLLLLCQFCPRKWAVRNAVLVLTLPGFQV